MLGNILRLDSSGNPVKWIDYEEAACYYSKNLVGWTVGDPFRILRGGRNRFSGDQSFMEIHPVIAIKGKAWTRFPVPPLTNPTLFRRDGNICLYCGNHFHDKDLTRDHIHPVSKNGKDVWTNVVTACRRCNSHKGSSTLDQAGMKLLAVPYTPNRYEYMYLTGRRIIADQMDFLRAGFHNLQA